MSTCQMIMSTSQIIVSTCQKNVLSTKWHELRVDTFLWWIFKRVGKWHVNKKIDKSAWLSDYYVKLIRCQFWCTRYTFRLLKSLQWYPGQKVVNLKKKPSWENCIRAGKKNPKYCAVKLSQIRRMIELCMREIIPRLEMNL
jgi:hypothetical protein